MKRKDSKGRALRDGETQRADGKYMYRYTDRNGVRRSVYSWKLVSTDKLKNGQRGEESLRDMEKRIYDDLSLGVKTYDADHITVDDLFRQFMDIRKDLKESSRSCYKDLYMKHVSPKFGSIPINKVKPTEIHKFYQDMLHENVMKPSTLQKVHTILYQVFENAVLDGALKENPSANALRKISKTTDFTSAQKQPLTDEQQQAFVDYLYHTDRCTQLRNLFTVLLGTGMRIGEALGLRWCDCDLEGGMIYVTHTLSYKRMEDGKYHYRVTSPKTKAGNRPIPMLDDVKTALHTERKVRRAVKSKFTVDGYTDFVFLNSKGRVYTQTYVYDEIQRLVTAYNQEEFAKSKEEQRKPMYLPKISAHIFRHTFCTRACEKGVNVKVLQEFMGHQNIRTTMDTYTKATTESKITAMKSLNGKFKIL